MRHELPGVGENLRDHYVPRTRWLVGKKGITFNDRLHGLGLVHQAMRYAVLRQGLLAMTGAPLRAFVCSREGLEAPDLMLGWIPMLTEPSPKGPRISRQSGMTLYAHAMRPESKGHVHITAADARRPPAINFNFLSSPPDAELTVRAVRIARAIMTAPAMTPFQVSEVAPGADRTTDDEILDWVKKAAETTYHPVGTCKMGSDPMAVVDAQLRVHGIAGLRVADASIMPTLTSGNTNAPSIMIGEKAADMVLNSHNLIPGPLTYDDRIRRPDIEQHTADPRRLHHIRLTSCARPGRMAGKGPQTAEFPRGSPSLGARPMKRRRWRSPPR